MQEGRQAGSQAVRPEVGLGCPKMSRPSTIFVPKCPVPELFSSRPGLFPSQNVPSHIFPSRPTYVCCPSLFSSQNLPSHIIIPSQPFLSHVFLFSQPFSYQNFPYRNFTSCYKLFFHFCPKVSHPIQFSFCSRSIFINNVEIIMLYLIF